MNELKNKEVCDFINANCIYPDFPCKGVNFIDIFPLLQNESLEDFKDLLIVEPIVLVPESRGFLFYKSLGPSRVLPLRKQGKLPGELIEITYHKEYGDDKLFFQKSLLKSLCKNWTDKGIKIPVCVFDDVLATGGTALSIINTINNLNLDGYTFEVTSAKFYISIKNLKGTELLNSEFPKLNVESLYVY